MYYPNRVMVMGVFCRVQFAQHRNVMLKHVDWNLEEALYETNQDVLPQLQLFSNYRRIDCYNSTLNTI